METLTIILLIVIGVLIIAVVVATIFAFRHEECPRQICGLSYSFSTFPNTQFADVDPISQDTIGITEAQAKCISDANCAAIVRYNNTNFYYTSAAPILRASGPTTLYVKQPVCSV